MLFAARNPTQPGTPFRPPASLLSQGVEAEVLPSASLSEAAEVEEMAAADLCPRTPLPPAAEATPRGDGGSHVSSRGQGWTGIPETRWWMAFVADPPPGLLVQPWLWRIGGGAGRGNRPRREPGGCSAPSPQRPGGGAERRAGGAGGAVPVPHQPDRVHPRGAAR